MTELLNSLSVGNAFKYFVVLVQRMPNFVDGLILADNELAVLESLGLEEESNFVT